MISCVTAPSPITRFNSAQSLATSRGWDAVALSAGQFDLIAFHPATFKADRKLTVYIEGDGFAWITSSTPSDDPTPINPVGLKLALAQPSGNAAYLARPCQYRAQQKRNCTQRYWTEARFAPEVIDSMNKAVTKLKSTSGATELSLVGYSGGAAIAALIAVRRSDVVELVTVAGNLDHRVWTNYHRLSPLDGSLNPADYAGRLGHVQQTHFVGGRDRVIPPSLALLWPEAFSGPQKRNIQTIQSFDHACCWERDWAKLKPVY